MNAVAVTCGMSAIGASERKSLIHAITSSGWREDGVVWHVTSECASSVYEATNNILRTSEGISVHSVIRVLHTVLHKTTSSGHQKVFQFTMLYVYSKYTRYYIKQHPQDIRRYFINSFICVLHTVLHKTTSSGHQKVFH